MKKFIVRTIEATALMLLVAGSILSVSDWMQRHEILTTERQEEHVHQVIGQPYLHHGDKIPNNIFKTGDIIFVHNKYIKTTKCHVQVANLFIDPQSNNVLHQSQFLNWFDPGTFTANEMLEIPEWLPPGRYRVLKKSTSFCGEKTYYFVNFDLEMVVEPTTGK